MFVVTMALSRVRHHFLMVDVSVATEVALAEMLNVPSTLPLLGVFQATEGAADAASAGLAVVDVIAMMISRKTDKNLAFLWKGIMENYMPTHLVHV